jgi:hypothetical protein
MPDSFFHGKRQSKTVQQTKVIATQSHITAFQRSAQIFQLAQKQQQINFRLKPTSVPGVPLDVSPAATTAQRHKECNETVFDAEGATAMKEQAPTPSHFTSQTAAYAAARTTSSFLKAAVADSLPNEPQSTNAPEELLETEKLKEEYMKLKQTLIKLKSGSVSQQHFEPPSEPSRISLTQDKSRPSKIVQTPSH